MKEFTVNVTEAIPRTPTCVSIRMEKPEGFSFRAGQWGLFTPLRGGNTESRPLSYSSSPTEPLLEFTKRITESEFSSTVSSTEPGDQVRFTGPTGSLVFEDTGDRIIFIAGGIGITPVRSILRYIADTGQPQECALLYANRCLEEIAFREELDRMVSKGSWLKVVHVLEDPPQGWDGPVGFITPEIVGEHITETGRTTIFLCGPPPMVSCLNGFLSDMGVPEDNVRKEELVGYESMT